MTPPFLAGYEEWYDVNPRAATLKWYRDARFGLQIHYGIYSQVGHTEKVMLREKPSVAEYRALADSFDPSGFDAQAITSLAVAGGFKYICMCARHHDSFALFRSDYVAHGFDRYNAFAVSGRDLVGELAESCARAGLGLFFYYSLGRDWVHPYFYDRGASIDLAARPAYGKRDPAYQYAQPEDFRHYRYYCHTHLRELLTRYGPIAGFWFDPESAVLGHPEMFKVEQTYRLIREMQPQALIAWKRGVTGDEDFRTPELREYRGHISAAKSLEDVFAQFADDTRSAEEKKRIVMRARAVDLLNGEKPVEFLQNLLEGVREDWQGPQPPVDNSGGYCTWLEHLSAAKLVRKYTAVPEPQGANFLVALGLLPDGSVHDADREALTGFGEWTRRLHRT